MAELTSNIVKQAFKSQSITQKDYLSSDELYTVLCNLNKSDFDEETFQEIWDQCKLNSKGQVRISDFIQFILKGEQLLLEKKQENANELLKLENEMKGKITDYADQHKYKEQMEALIEETEGVQNSLAIIRNPFIVPADVAARQGHSGHRGDANEQLKSQIQQNDIMRQLFEYDSSETAGTLTNIFYVTCGLTLITWVGSLFICQFLSLITYTVILSQFLFQIISRKMVKFNLILLSICTLWDVVWLIIQTGNIWYLPSNYELPRMDSSFLKFSIILIILCACLRMLLIYYYLSQFHLDQFQVYAIKVIGRELNIQREPEPYTPNKNPLSFYLQPYFNKAAQGEQIQ